MKDILGSALQDFQNKKYTDDIITYSSLDEQDKIPIPYFFRTYDELPKLEQKALSLCRGTILDIGCGAGSHSLYLQEKGFDITALDFSQGATDVCKLRGIEKVVHSNILDYNGTKFDTLLMLMNGIGIVGKLTNLNLFLSHLKLLMKPNGQVLLDSSDIIYMYEEDDDGGYWIPDNKEYYGEVEFTMEYKGNKGKPFSWLYIDYNTLQRAALANGLECELISEGDHYDYLAKLTNAKQ
ncbi:SAM-dependent methyltransferase [Saonia flava]|uniref:SAM-dependent methyltransferase n=1 Tax=Saonia flava TaxID=523696 RepID=A0A846QWG6_9FLAO|nr:methyltransferase domain-containing protein [Saonia flava]NJB72681.1 SAM-dependent methyltransferase [Saonia flava]